MIVWRLTWTQPGQGRQVSWFKSKQDLSVALRNLRSDALHKGVPVEELEPCRIDRTTIPTASRASLVDWLNDMVNKEAP